MWFHISAFSHKAITLCVKTCLYEPLRMTGLGVSHENIKQQSTTHSRDFNQSGYWLHSSLRDYRKRKMFRTTHLGVGSHTGCVRGIIHELETGLKFKQDRPSEAGYMLKPTERNCLELEVVDQGARPSYWQLNQGILVINSEKPAELIPILAELGFDEMSKGSLIFRHRELSATPPFKLVEAADKMASWHIGIHFENVPSMKDFKETFFKENPALAPLVSTPLANARGKQHCCISSKPIRGLVIEVTTGRLGFTGHGPARSDLIQTPLTKHSHYTCYGK